MELPTVFMGLYDIIGPCTVGPIDLYCKDVSVCKKEGWKQTRADLYQVYTVVGPMYDTTEDLL